MNEKFKNREKLVDKYMVGNGMAGKDQYKVGQNGKDKYMVGGGGQAPGQANNQAFVKYGSGDPVVESKSNFNYSHNTDATAKDIGDQSENMNMGGAVKNGIQNMQGFDAGGDIKLTYDQSQDWDAKKNAMARRKGHLDNMAKLKAGDQFNSPVPDGYKDNF